MHHATFAHVIISGLVCEFHTIVLYSAVAAKSPIATMNSSVLPSLSRKDDSITTVYYKYLPVMVHSGKPPSPVIPMTIYL